MTQSHVCGYHKAAGPEVRALVVTGRWPLDFGARPVVRIWPEAITTDKAVFFLTEYLARSGHADLFPGRQALDLSQRVMTMLEASGQARAITPLFIAILTRQAIALRQAGEPLDRLPQSIPDTIVEHLKRTNPGDPGTLNWIADDDLIRAAKLLAREALGSDYIPKEIFRDDAGRLLRAEGLLTADRDPLRRLIDNGIVDRRDRGGTPLIRFVLDPVAEHLAALAWIATACARTSRRGRRGSTSWAVCPGSRSGSMDFSPRSRTA